MGDNSSKTSSNDEWERMRQCLSDTSSGEALSDIESDGTTTGDFPINEYRALLAEERAISKELREEVSRLTARLEQNLKRQEMDMEKLSSSLTKMFEEKLKGFEDLSKKVGAMEKWARKECIKKKEAEKNEDHLVVLLIRVLEHCDNPTIRRIAVLLLRFTPVKVEEKVDIGNSGAIEVILDQIKKEHSQWRCDEVMTFCWGFLWSLTDEIPANCVRFLKAGGLYLFEDCYNRFVTNRMCVTAVRNMTGVMANIAEVGEARRQLMNDEIVKIFVTLLEYNDDSTGIAYNSASVLANMVSDGEVAWQKLTISRDDVMQNIIKVMSSWKIHTHFSVSYRSLRPFFRLLLLRDSYASQLWAVWSLANLTTTNAAKYCALAREEGGLPILLHLATDWRTADEIRQLANIVLLNEERSSKEEGSLSHLIQLASDRQTKEETSQLTIPVLEQFMKERSDLLESNQLAKLVLENIWED